MNTAYLLLGSNIGDCKEHLAAGKTNIEKKIGGIIRSSCIYKTEAWGNNDQPAFLNQVVITETTLGAEQTMNAILAIEEKMGRKRTLKNAPRIIDIDLLFFNNEVINSKSLTVPHPEIPNRRFVLVPMNELSPSFIHPVQGKNISRLLKDCPDRLNVQKI